MSSALLYHPNALYWIIFIGIALASWIVSASLDSKFKKYSKVSIGLTGREVAEKMLRESGITDVQVKPTKGRLSDFYNPTDKTVYLSEGVYESSSVAAAAVAAHECGHAVQHATEYAPLVLRTSLVPVVSFAGRWMTWVLLAGMLLLQTMPAVLGVGIVLFALTTLFSFVTLPVEVDASRRAVSWLDEAGITNRETAPMAQSALRSAAFTYVVAALGSLANLMYYILIFISRRD